MRLTVSADDLLEAVPDAVEVFTKAAALLGLPAGEIVVVEAMTEEESGRRLSRS